MTTVTTMTAAVFTGANNPVSNERWNQDKHHNNNSNKNNNDNNDNISKKQ